MTQGGAASIHTPRPTPPLSCHAPAEHQPFGSSSLPIKDPNMDFPSIQMATPTQHTLAGHILPMHDKPQSRSDPIRNQSTESQPRVPRPLPPLSTMLDNPSCPAPPGPQWSHILSHSFLKSKGTTRFKKCPGHGKRMPFILFGVRTTKSAFA